MPTLNDLPPQQRKVALLIAKGLAYKAVAAALSTSPTRPYSVRTVEWHAMDIVRRLDLDPATGTMDAKLLAPRQRIIVWVLAEQLQQDAAKREAA